MPIRFDDEDDEDESASKEKESPSSQMEKALFDARTILLTGEINDRQAKMVCAQLLGYASVSEKPILLVLSSPGGHGSGPRRSRDAVRHATRRAGARGARRANLARHRDGRRRDRAGLDAGLSKEVGPGVSDPLLRRDRKGRSGSRAWIQICRLSHLGRTTACRRCRPPLRPIMRA